MLSNAIRPFMNVRPVIALVRFIVISSWLTIWAVFSRPTFTLYYFPRFAPIGKTLLSPSCLLGPFSFICWTVFVTSGLAPRIFRKNRPHHLPTKIGTYTRANHAPNHRPDRAGNTANLRPRHRTGQRVRTTRVTIYQRIATNIAVRRPLPTAQPNRVRLHIPPTGRIIVPIRVVMLTRLRIIDLPREARVVREAAETGRILIRQHRPA